MNKVWLWMICLLATLLGSAGQASAQGYRITIDANNRQEIKGWGIYTQNRPDWYPFEENNISLSPVACDALYGSNGIGANVLRFAFPPQCYVSDGVLDQNMMQGMKRHLQAALNRGVTKWFVTLWTPPGRSRSSTPITPWSTVRTTACAPTPRHVTPGTAPTC